MAAPPLVPQFPVMAVANSKGTLPDRSYPLPVEACTTPNLAQAKLETLQAKRGQLVGRLSEAFGRAQAFSYQEEMAKHKALQQAQLFRQAKSSQDHQSQPTSAHNPCTNRYDKSRATGAFKTVTRRPSSQPPSHSGE